MKNVFRSVSTRVSTLMGSPYIFILAVLTIVTWALSGKYFNYSDTWQLVINTGTTIVTFLMVFLIQNTQNRDSKAMQIKLDELLRSTKGARNLYVSLEDLSDDEISALNRQFQEFAHKPGAARAIRKLHKSIEAESASRKNKPLRISISGLQRARSTDDDIATEDSLVTPPAK
ncbi:MAG: low affinity iron permease family protein [Candidatus Saccharibacteria bacterium]|nr:low affinity iron permease family protein [Candidatus Saccharibacteria bacterium]